MKLQDLLKDKNPSKRLLKLNLFFIFIFLNAWDFATTRGFFTAMVFGLLMFGPIAFLWFLGKLRAIALVTFISIFEFLVMTTFVLEGIQLSGAANSIKSIYWVPFLIMTGVNGFWGLKIYSESREKK